MKEVKKMQQMARQGDVLFINKDNKNLRESTHKRLFGTKAGNPFDFNKEGRLPMAYGEVSGHCHGIYTEGTAQLLVSSDIQETQKHLTVTGEAVVQHEEHDAIRIAEGENAVLIQNEFRLEKIQRTVD